MVRVRGPLSFAILAATLAAFAYCLGATVVDAGTVAASCYGAEAGNMTASGEAFNPSGLTAAHRSLPFGTRLLVRHGRRAATVTVNDRGPAAWTGKDIDLAQGACQSIGLDGIGEVEVSEVPSSSASKATESLPETGAPK